MSPEVKTRVGDLLDSFFDDELTLTVTGGGTNTFTLAAGDGELDLNINGTQLRMTSPATLDLSTVEGGGNPVDDGLPFRYIVWVEETGGPGACATDSLDCAVLGGTLDAITAQEHADNALLASVAVQTPGTVGTDGPAFFEPFFHEIRAASANTQNAAGFGRAFTAATSIAVTGIGTSLLNLTEVLWITARGSMLDDAFAMVSEPAYVLGALADAAGQEPLDPVNSMADILETADGTAIPVNDYFHLVLRAGIYVKDAIDYSRVFLVLPTCTYAANRLNDAEQDANGCASALVPSAFQSSELLARILVKNDTDNIEQIALEVDILGGLGASQGTVRGPPVVLPGNAVIFDGPSGQFIDVPATAPIDGDVLTWDNLAAAADWLAPSGGGGGGTQVLKSVSGVGLNPANGVDVTSPNPALTTGTNFNADLMLFDSTLLECAGFQWFDAVAGTKTIHLSWIAITAATANARWILKVGGDTLDPTFSDEAVTLAANTVSGTLVNSSWTFTTTGTGQRTSLICRDGPNLDDTLAGEAGIQNVTITVG
jgi:hypothetical protein